MLAEALAWVTTPCSPAARKLGLLGDLIALRAREGRLRKAWKPHLQACQSQIIRAAEQLRPLGSQPQGRCVVLGSGWLFDVPLSQLTERFAEVVLVDILHPRAVRQQVRRMRAVRLVEADLTDILDWLVSAPMEVPGIPVGFAPEVSGLCAEADLIISCNLLSQLAVAPRRVLEQHGPALSDQEMEQFCAGVVRAHLQALAVWSGSEARRVLLITDTQREERDPAGQRPSERFDLLYGQRPRLEPVAPDMPKSWIWDLAPPPEEGRDRHIRHRVIAGWLSPPPPS